MSKLDNKSSQVLEARLDGGSRVLLLEDSRFASLQVMLWYTLPLQSDLPTGFNLSQAALLPLCLRRGSESLPSHQDMVIALEQLWGAEVQAGVGKRGGYHITYFDMDFTDPRFLPPSATSMLAEGVGLLADLVQKPLLTGSAFPEEIFQEEKEVLMSTQARLIHNRGAYAMDRCLQAMYKGNIYGMNRLGTVEQTLSLTSGDLAAYYHRFRQEAQLTIGICGAEVGEHLLPMLGGTFGQQAHPTWKLVSLPRPLGDTVQEITEELPGEQSQLIVAFCSPVAYEDPLSRPLQLLSGLWGDFAHSRLFRRLREEEGLTYNPWTRLDRVSGTIFAGAGLDAEDAEAAVAMIQEELASLQQGQISDDEWQKTRLSLQHSYLQMADDPSSILEFTFNSSLLGRHQTIEEAIREIMSITKEEVSAAAHTLQLHTVYLLDGMTSELRE